MIAIPKTASQPTSSSSKSTVGSPTGNDKAKPRPGRNWARLAFGNSAVANDANLVQRKCATCEDEALVQPKLTIGKADDPYEREADDIAERVMRMPTTAGGATVDQELVQPKPMGSSSGSNAANANQGSSALHGAIASPGQGTTLSSHVRQRVEPVLGADLSKVRVHSGQLAQTAAADIRAKAFTNRNNIYLGANQSSNDVGLMAHELTHVVQQSGLRPAARSADIQRKGEVDTDAVVAGVGASSGAASKAGIGKKPCDFNETNPIIWFEYDSDQIRTTGGVNSIVHLMAAIRRAQHHISEAGSDAKIYLYGYASEEGDDAYNKDLSQKRAVKIRELMVDAGIDPANLVAVGLGEDISLGARPLNRRVEICPTPRIEYIELPEEVIDVDPMDCEAPHKAADLTQYAFLIRCLELHLASTHGPLDILKTLRELYYGNSRFDSAACGDSESGTVTALNASAPDLVTALKLSKVTSGVDMGHVFTGLEGMLCPRTTTSPAWYAPTVNMANEDFLTWGGDIGSAAAGRVDGYNRSGWVFKSPPPWSEYFLTAKKLASEEDLLGDIDSFVFRANMRGVACSSTKGTRMPSPSTPISRLFLDYYSAPPGMATGLTSTDRFRCFAEAAGATIRGNSITNKAALVSTYSPGVRSFANVFYLNLARLRIIGRNDIVDMILLSRYSEEITEMFFDWIESRL